MRISIIIPSFNQSLYLSYCLESVIKQAYRDKEIIVMDGGSTDGSVDIIKRYEKELSFWRSEPDGGQASAIASGFERATGSILTWLNSDDILLPNALFRVSDAARKLGSVNAVFFGGYQIVDSSGQIKDVFPAFSEPGWVRKLLGPNLCQPATFFGRDIYKEVGGIDRSLLYCMDIDLWLKFLFHGVSFIPVKGYLAQFRRHPSQKGQSIDWQRVAVEEALRIRERYFLPNVTSTKFQLARCARWGLGLLTGANMITIAYRIIFRKTLSEYF